MAYFPVDWVPFSARAWDAFSPDLAIVTEGERWPEHLHQAKARGVPVLCINARISERSFRRSALPRGRAVRAGRDDPAARRGRSWMPTFRELGFPRVGSRSRGTSSWTWTSRSWTSDDGRPAPELGLAAGTARPSRRVHVARRGGGACRRARLGPVPGLGCSLLIVPRHAERRAEIERLLRATGLVLPFPLPGPVSGAVHRGGRHDRGAPRDGPARRPGLHRQEPAAPLRGTDPGRAGDARKGDTVGPGWRISARSRRTCLTGARRGRSPTPRPARESVALLGDKAARDGCRGRGGWRRDNGGGVAQTLEAIRAELGRGY